MNTKNVELEIQAASMCTSILLQTLSEVSINERAKNLRTGQLTQSPPISSTAGMISHKP